MDKFVARIFHAEIATQCRFILAAANDLASITDGALVPGLGLTDPYWQPLQTILVSAANVSKILWGTSAKIAARREPLRSALGVTDSSPLHDRELRNHFEHFDEKLEKWSSAPTRRNYVGRNVGPDRDAEEREDRFAHFDPATGTVTFWGYSIVVEEVLREAARIQPLAEAGLCG